VDEKSSSKGKIIAIGFLAVMVLPVCYALLKELRHRQLEKQKTTQQAPAAPAVK
jgi:hypothetical protein